MRAATMLLLSLCLTLAVVGCKKNEPVKDGAHTGTISKVNADEKEIYVTTEEDVTLELYFTDETTLTKDGQPAEFDVLEEKQTVTVVVENKDGKVVPVAVMIGEVVEMTPEAAAAAEDVAPAGSETTDAETEAAIKKKITETVEQNAGEQGVGESDGGDTTEDMMQKVKEATDATKTE
jgi:cold shock protein